MKRRQTTTTIEQAFNTFIEDRQLKGISNDCLRNYRQSYYTFIKALNISPDDNISLINQQAINQFITLKLQILKPVSLNHYLRDLRVWLNYMGLNINLHMVKHPEVKIEGYSNDEVKLLLQTPDKTANYSVWKSWLIACIILGTGARIGSVVSLHKQDIDYSNKTITFPHSKNGKTLILPITDSLIKCIKAFETVWDNNTDWLVPNFDGTQSTPHGCLQAFNKYCIFVQVAQMGLHALRHTFARLSIEAGMDLYTLNRFLAHSDIRMTEHYVNVFATNLSTTAIPLDNLLKDSRVRRHNNLSGNDRF